MRATGTFRATRPPTGHVAGDVSRAFVAGGALAGVCGLAVVVALWTHASMEAAARARAAAAEGDLTTGSMLVVSPGGRLCSQRSIDNSTWRIHTQGWVDCDEALAKTTNSGNETTPMVSRLDAIREGFRGKQ